jgi:hypothetical protein
MVFCGLVILFQGMNCVIALPTSAVEIIKEYDPCKGLESVHLDVIKIMGN